MATVDQIKQLIRAHYERNDERFKTAAIQIAASEAKAGHTTQARSYLKRQDSKIRYSLVVTLSTPNIETKLYTEITNKITVAIAANT